MKNRSLYLIAAALLALTLLAYLPAIQDGGYIWDDDHYVTENGLLGAEDGFERIWFQPRLSPQYYPLVFTTFRIEYQLNQALRDDGNGLAPFIFHLTNVLIHALSAILLWRLLGRLKIPGALLAAAIFAIHPVHVESVAWITERKNVLSGLFYLLSLHAYLNWTDLDTGETRKTRWYLLALLAFAMALFSKTVTSTLGPVILLLVWWRRGSIAWKDVNRTLPFFALGLMGAAMTAWTELDHVEARGPEWDLSIAERFLVAGRSATFYAQKIFWPRPLIFSYEKWTLDAGSLLQWAFPVAVLGTMALLLVLALRGKISRAPATALMFFTGTLFPALGFINVYPFRYSYVADHFQYLASLGIIVPVAAFLALRLPKPALIGVGAVLVLVLSVLSYQQCAIYENEETLWFDTIDKNPQSWMAYNNIGMIYFREGRRDEAEEYIRRAAELGPHAREVLNNVGLYEAARAKHDVAIEWFDKALSHDPRHTASLANKALSMMFRSKRDSDLEEALETVDRAMKVAYERNSDYAHGRLVRGQILHRLGRDDEALLNIDMFLKREWNNPLAHTERGRITKALGRKKEAEVCVKRALEIDQRYSPALIELAQLLAERRDFDNSARAWASALGCAGVDNIGAIINQSINMGFNAVLRRPAKEGAAFALELARITGGRRGSKLYEEILSNLRRTRRIDHFNTALELARKAELFRSDAEMQATLAGLQPL